MGPNARLAATLGTAVPSVATIFIALSMGWWVIHTDANPWTIGGHEYHFVATSTDLPGSSYRTQCWVNNTSMPGFGSLCAAGEAQGYLTPYYSSGEGSASFAQLYSNLFWVVLLSGGAGVVGVLGVVAQPALARRVPAFPFSFFWAILLVAGLIAVATPLGFMVAEPGAYTTIHPATAVNSFWGSCASTTEPGYCGPNGTQSWGPGAGWFLAFLGGGLLVVSGVVGRGMARTAHRPSNR